MMTRKVYIIGGNDEYISMFESEGWKVVYDLLDADMLQFTGGEDVTPSIYGEKAHPTTDNNIERDLRERLIFNVAYKQGLPMAGICRGGQFLNVMCGGSLWQNVDGHGRTHVATDTITGENFNVTSTHHQMMVPALNGAEVVVEAQCSTYREHVPHNNSIKIFDDKMIDIEAVYYDKFNAFCFQPHPEFYGQEDLKFRYMDYLEIYLFDYAYDTLTVVADVITNRGTI